MSYNLPSPPSLKTTIIQTNKDLDQENGNFEILTNQTTDCNQKVEIDSNSANTPLRKKRRRSTNNIDEEELARRKFETKQLHSVIEKRRRIKINREFEALKYIIPACRNGTEASSKPGCNGSNNSNSKIDGMYKLTILKSSVEYILYLHKLIQQQRGIIKNFDNDFEFDCGFTEVPLNVNEYRNIDTDFNFKTLSNEIRSVIPENEEVKHGIDHKLNSNDVTTIPDRKLECNSSSIEDKPKSEEDIQLPSPMITPDMQANHFKYHSKFQLPDPALALPRKMVFKSPPKQSIVNNDADSDASKTLMSLRKSNIDSLLN